MNTHPAPHADPTQPPLMSVTLVSRLLKNCVEDAFANVRVQGEVSMPKLHTSGHLYCAIKDDQATLDAVCWRPLAAKIAPLLAHGKKVICLGKITTYASRSKYQLVIQQAWPQGEGELYMILAALKAKLLKEGLFAPERKRALPPYPKTIGLITSAKGAVIQDILHRLKARFPVKVLLCDVSVQGDKAAQEVIGAFQLFEKLAAHNHPLTPDLLMVARGGGSLEDLWTFNEEAVVRAVAAATLPVISAIGHETDTTLTDYVADKRAPTPTAAAEMATPLQDTLKTHLQQAKDRLLKGLQNKISLWTQRTTFLTHRLKGQDNCLQAHEQRLDDLQSRFATKGRFLEQKTQHLHQTAGRLRTPRMLCQMHKLALHNTKDRLHKGFAKRLETQTTHFDTLSKRLMLSSYQKALDRGFCLALSNQNTPLTSVAAAQKESVLQLMFKDGTLKATPLSDANQKNTP